MIPRAVIVAFVLCAAVRAHAQPASVQAEALFRQGRALMTAGKFAEACVAFEGSQKLDPSISTLLNLGSCREKAGQVATAWGVFLDAERMSRSAADSAGHALHQAAVNLADKLEPHVPKLTVRVPTESRVAGLVVTRNGIAVDSTLWNSALPIDGGTYAIAARAPGMTDWTGSVTLKVRDDSKAIEIPRLAPRASTSVPAESPTRPITQPMTPPVATAEPQQAVASPAEPVDAPVQPQASKLIPLAIGAGGIALLAGGLAFEVSARSTYDDAKREPDDNMQVSLWKRANTQRHVAQVFAGAGLIGAGVGIWLFMRAGGGEAATTTTSARGVQVQPVATATTYGLQLTGWY